MADEREPIPACLYCCFIDAAAGLFAVSTLTALPDIKCTQGRFIVMMYGQTAVAAGTYTFSYREDSQKIKKLPARFTFVYQKQGGQWMIVNQHSSLLPDKKTDE